jgi:hypothetical protein
MYVGSFMRANTPKVCFKGYLEAGKNTPVLRTMRAEGLKVYTTFMKNADSLPIMLFETRQDWKAWLKEHHAETRGIWLKIAKKRKLKPVPLEYRNLSKCSRRTRASTLRR